MFFIIFHYHILRYMKKVDFPCFCEKHTFHHTFHISLSFHMWSPIYSIFITWSPIFIMWSPIFPHFHIETHTHLYHFNVGTHFSTLYPNFHMWSPIFYIETYVVTYFPRYIGLIHSGNLFFHVISLSLYCNY